MFSQINILVKAEDAEAARETAMKISYFTDKSRILIIPLSKDGSTPASHFYCAMNYVEDRYKELMELKKLTEIEVGSPKEFITSRNLKIVK